VVRECHKEEGGVLTINEREGEREVGLDAGVTSADTSTLNPKP
jgi:hypothetical protein